MNHDLTTRAGQISHYAAVRARIAAAAYRPPVHKKKELLLPLIPEWKQRPTKFNAHIISYIFRNTMSEHIRWLRDRCTQLEISYNDIIGDKKKRKYAYPRFQLMYEMRKEFPNLSSHKIGKAFGGRDHSSVIHGIKKWEVLRHEND